MQGAARLQTEKKGLEQELAQLEEIAANTKAKLAKADAEEEKQARALSDGAAAQATRCGARPAAISSPPVCDACA